MISTLQAAEDKSIHKTAESLVHSVTDNMAKLRKRQQRDTGRRHRPAMPGNGKGISEDMKEE